MRVWLRQNFPAIDRLVDQYGYWASFFGAVWGGMSWAASSMPSIAHLGWGAYVFAGLGATCVLILVISAGLVAWRLFKPLPAAAQPGVPEAGLLFEPVDNPLNDEALNDAYEQIIVLKEQAAARDKQLAEIEARLSECVHYVELLATILQWEFSIDLLQRATEIPFRLNLIELDQLTADGCLAIKSIALRYEREVLATVDSRWQLPALEALQFGARSGESSVENIRPEDRPADVDLLDLRKTIIAHSRASSLKAKIDELLTENLIVKKQHLGRVNDIINAYSKK